jgi:hypothetical protein
MHLFMADYTSHEQEYLFLVYFTYFWSILLMFRQFFSFCSLHIGNLEEFFCEMEMLENGTQVAIRRMEFATSAFQWNSKTFLAVKSPITVASQKYYPAKSGRNCKTFWTCISKLGLK